MIFSFSKPALSLRRICQKQFSSLTKIDTTILKNLAVLGNPSALKVELLRVVKESAEVSNQGNFPKLIAQICVNKKNVEIELAVEILRCLEHDKPKSMLLGLYELIDKCVDCGHINGAMKIYSRLRSMSEKLDASGKQRLLSALSYDCRIKDIMLVLQDQYITDCDLVTVSEPLIMTGNMKIFSIEFRKFIDQKSITSAPDGSEKVARVIRSMIHAQMRRHIQLSNFTSEERKAVKETLAMLKDYHSLDIHDNVTQSPSYFQACQLLEIEREHFLPKEIAVYDSEMTYQEFRSTNRLPKFEANLFPYLIESNDAALKEMMRNKAIKDLSSELKRQDPNRVLVFRSSIFPTACELEKKLLKEKNLEKFFERISDHDHTSYSLIGAAGDDGAVDSDSDDDSDDDGYDSMETQYEEFYGDLADLGSDSDSDDESDDDEQSDLVSLITDFGWNKTNRMRRTARTLLPPAFSLQDITRTLEKRNPSVDLEFSEDIFDFGQEPNSWPHIFMPGGFILHENETKDPILKN